MISHFNIGTNNVNAAEAFFNELLAVFGGALAFKNDRTLFYAFADGGAKLAVNQPFNGEPASVGNGSMVAFSANDNSQVDTFYATALKLGATCEGKPGPRMDGAMYAAYFRDLDGNKFGVFTSPQA